MTTYFKQDTKIDKTTNQLFDIKTSISNGKRDLDLSPTGSLQRIIGLDKLVQQVTKALLVKKGTYLTVPKLGLSISSGQGIDEALITSSLVESLTIFAQQQQQRKRLSGTTILGRNIYRTVDINNSDSWEKLNDYIVSDNTFTDLNVIVGNPYYYALTSVYTDTTNNTKETPIITSQSTVATVDETLGAQVSNDFILVNGNSNIALYWNITKELNSEEQLRSIYDVKVTRDIGDPRGIKIYVSVTNVSLNESQISI